jgi:very-short-patch-repair endonuclease
MDGCLGCTPVIAARDAAELGLGRRGLQRLLADGVLLAPQRGVLVGSCQVERAAADRRLDHLLQLQILLTVYPDAAASHDSAALVARLPLLMHPRLVTVTRRRGAWRGGAQSRVRIARLPASHLTTVDGIRTTTVRRTFVDIARSATFREAVVVGDAAVRRGFGVADLREAVEECAEWADVGKARRAVRFLDGRAESPLESVSRAIMHEFDVRPPELQTPIRLDATTEYRADFYWKARRVIGEADGMAKYDEPAALRAEKLRQERLERAGFAVVRWTWDEMLNQTDATIARIQAKLATHR